ncbi:sulfite oxidase-like [Clavelina lepadiformis]|uniref:sulfite oxidase-like n=1 Tax=Clavelina lepadiformis TaxID=159417 RepID=UPI0040411AC4
MSLVLTSLCRTESTVCRHSTAFTRAFSSNTSKKRFRSSSHQETKQFRWKLAAAASGAVVGMVTYNYIQNKPDLTFLRKSVQAKSDPVYSSADVAQHADKQSGIWVTYQDSVYDITGFVESHPGGEKILMGAGGPIDAFWNMYAVHKTPEVLQILEQYRIGKLSRRDQKAINLNDPFANEPFRLPVLRINSQKPFNAEPPLEVLTDSFITPNELFYVRNHLPVPDFDLENFKLEVLVGGRKLALSVDEIKKKYKPVTITTTIQCAGNRRQEMSQYQNVKGLTWGACAIGTARWTGVRLRDILLDAGFDLNDNRFKHIQFNGNDKDITKSSYGGSIPKHKAMSIDGDVIIAYKMNGVDIPRDHGYPLRVIVPGYVGARNVKWLHQVVASDEESSSHWQRNDYKVFSPSTTFETADYKKAQSIQEMPVISAISTPAEGSKVESDDGVIEVKGYAWSGGGRDIIRVDVSADGGKTWKEANLVKDKPGADDSTHSWAWSLWNAEVEVTPGKKTEIVCKAIDSAYNCQPEFIGPIWNLRGFLTNAWHRISVEVEDDE